MKAFSASLSLEPSVLVAFVLCVVIDLSGYGIPTRTHAALVPWMTTKGHDA